MSSKQATDGYVLVVDDEKLLAQDFTFILKRAGYQTATAGSVGEAMDLFPEFYPDVVLMDICLPDGDGKEAMAKLKATHPEVEFIMVTAHGSIPSAVECAQQGAFSYLTKPVEAASILLCVKNALGKKRKGDELRELRQLVICGRSDKCHTSNEYPSASIRRVVSLATKAAARDGNVLLLGESGTGKDHWSKWIHCNSHRKDETYLSINCATLSQQLAESELFGHEPGAFTGAVGRKRGLLELASGGTLLLNEIGELDLPIQAKLLTFLDTKQFLRVGGDKSIQVNVRIIAATNRDLEKEVEQGNFRKDLYYRLNVFQLMLPPLRDRVEDLHLLVVEMVDKLSRDLRIQPVPTISAEALDELGRSTWPGNNRELRNVLERGLMVCDGKTINRADVQVTAGHSPGWRLEVPFPQGKTLHDVCQQVADDLIAEAIHRTNTKKEAAQLLGISRDSLNYQLRSHKKSKKIK